MYVCMFLRVLQCLFRVFFLIFLFVDVVYLCFLSCRWFTSCNVPFHVRFTMCSLCFSSYAPHRVSGEGWWGWGWGVVGWSKNVHVYLRSGFVGLLDSPGLEHLACGPSPRGYPKGQLVAWGLNCDEVPFGPLDPNSRGELEKRRRVIVPRPTVDGSSSWFLRGCWQETKDLTSFWTKIGCR